jgi:hypothetical protein
MSSRCLQHSAKKKPLRLGALGASSGPFGGTRGGEGRPTTTSDYHKYAAVETGEYGACREKKRENDGILRRVGLPCTDFMRSRSQSPGPISRKTSCLILGRLTDHRPRGI